MSAQYVSAIAPTPAPRSCPVEVPFANLYRNTPYTLTPTPEEREKIRGHEPAWARRQAREQGTVYVWITDEAWERIFAPCHACQNEVDPGPWHKRDCEEYNADEKVAA